MVQSKAFDVAIIGGSYAGLSAALTLARAMHRVLIIDSGAPCNKQAQHAHSFITHDGEKGTDITAKALEEVLQYPTVQFFSGKATALHKKDNGFEVAAGTGETFIAKKILFATGISDLMPDIKGFPACWGISAVHCPYCFGYEVKRKKTAIMANGELALMFCGLISNWTKDITLLTNGPSQLTPEQQDKLKSHNIEITEQKIKEIMHHQGQIQSITLDDGSRLPVAVLYTKLPFTQHSDIPEKAGCELTEQGYIKVAEDGTQKTTVPGIYAAGDNTTMRRALVIAAAQGAAAGHSISAELIMEAF